MKKIVFALLIALLVFTACEQPKACTHAETETKVVKAATCKEGGENAIVCKSCGETIKTEATDALGHAIKETVNTATCEEAGSKTEACSRCDYTKTTDLDPLGHDYNVETVTPATCKDEGSQVITCKRCTYRVENPIPKTNNHTANGEPVEIITAPTCTEPGKGKYICGVCGVNFEGEIAAKHGKTIKFNTQKAAGADDGIICTYYCADCKEPIGESYSFGTPSEFQPFDISVDEEKKIAEILDDTFTAITQKMNSSELVPMNDGSKEYRAYSGEITGISGKTYSVDCSMGNISFAAEPPTACVSGTLKQGEASYEFTIVSNFDLASIAFFAEINGIKGSYVSIVPVGYPFTVFGQEAKIFYEGEGLRLAVFTEPLDSPDGDKTMQWGTYGRFIGDGDTATCSDQAIGAGAANTAKIMADEDSFLGCTDTTTKPIDPEKNDTVWAALKSFREKIGDTESKVFIPSALELSEIWNAKGTLGLDWSFPSGSGASSFCWSSSEFANNSKDSYFVNTTGIKNGGDRYNYYGAFACIDIASLLL